MCDDSYELFRRAVVERDADAWAAIAERYRPLLVFWVGRCAAAEDSGERYEDLADEALARAWRALSPQRFSGFPTLAALLSYLRACVSATVIDTARAHTAYNRLAEQAKGGVTTSTEQVVLEQLDRDEFWRLVSHLVVSETERVVLIERFVLDLPPRVIQARHPALFPNMVRIYTAIRNLCERLQRHQELQRIYADYVAA